MPIPLFRHAQFPHRGNFANIRARSPDVRRGPWPLALLIVFKTVSANPVSLPKGKRWFLEVTLRK